MSIKRLNNRGRRPREKIQSEWFIGKSQVNIFNGFIKEGWKRRNRGHTVFSKSGVGHISFPRRKHINPDIAALKFSQAGITRDEAIRILGIDPEKSEG
ncbi:hypothetical protein IIA94_00185 [Patescibacteria group bacterium]|nr:hypothetical protein [Patescibacteria group bacterium]